MGIVVFSAVTRAEVTDEKMVSLIESLSSLNWCKKTNLYDCCVSQLSPQFLVKSIKEYCLHLELEQNTADHPTLQG